jgi:predicted enzyme related to lactoylglutathione lyase
MGESGVELGTVIIMTARMDELASFYEAALGIGPFERDGDRHAGCRVGAVYFGLDRVDGVDRNAPPAVTAWFTVDDLDATFRRCVELGATIHSKPERKPWGARLAAVLDPDGNLLGLHQR